MSLDTLTHVWREVPFFSRAMERIPSHVTLIEAAPPPAAPWSNALPVQALFAHSATAYDAAVFEQLPNLRILQRTGIGVDKPEFGIRQDSQEQINFWCDPEKSCSKESNHEFTRTVL